MLLKRVIGRYWLVIGILLIALFLRLNNLSNIFVFSLDEEYQTTLAKTIVDDFHIIWIGVNASNSGFYLGPFWTYFTSFWLVLSKGDPIITAYIASLIGVATGGLLIWVGSKMFNFRVGLIAGLLYATLPLLVYFDQKYWNPTLTPLLSLLLLFSIYKSTKSAWWWILFAFAFGLVFHIHLSLIPLGLLALSWLIVKRNINKKIFLVSLFVFLLTISPLIAFDYFHKGSNITTPLRLREITAAETYRINPVHHSIAFYELLGRIFYLGPNKTNADEILFSCTSTSIYKSNPIVDQYSTRTKPIAALSFLSLVFLLYFFLRKRTWQKDNFRLVALATLAIVISFLLFPGGGVEYYLLGFFPLFLLIISVVVNLQKGSVRNIAAAFLILLAFLGIYTVFTAKDDFGIAAKKKLVTQVMDVVGNRPYKLIEQGMCHRFEGWRYLFTEYGGKPERSSVDENLGWLYPKEITENPVDYTVIITEKRVPTAFETKNAKVISQGGFSAYITKNN